MFCCQAYIVIISFTCRWVRFEEDVEECGKRWSKPHVPSFSLSAFNELKKTFESGLIVFDVIGQSLDQLLGQSVNYRILKKKNILKFILRPARVEMLAP